MRALIKVNDNSHGMTQLRIVCNYINKKNATTLLLVISNLLEKSSIYIVKLSQQKQ